MFTVLIVVLGWVDCEFYGLFYMYNSLIVVLGWVDCEFYEFKQNILMLSIFMSLVSVWKWVNRV